MTQARQIVANFAIDQETLTIISAHGTGTRPASPTGIVYTNDYGTTLTNRMTGLDWPGNGGTQYWCTGWTMTGNGPASGGATNMTMTQTNNAVLTWLWQTNYLLQLSTLPVGVTNAIVGATPGFKPTGAVYTLTPSPAFGYGFNHWEVNGATNFSSTLPLTMNGAKTVVAVFTPIFVDVTSQLDWSVKWLFNPRTGFFTGTLTITNRPDSAKAMLAPVWYEVESNAWHWLRFPTGFDANTGLYYLDVSTAVTNQLPHIGNGNMALDPGESVTVTGIQLMGRQYPTGLVVAVWADPPDSYGPAVHPPFSIWFSDDRSTLLWDAQPGWLYTVVSSTNLAQGVSSFQTLQSGIQIGPQGLATQNIADRPAPTGGSGAVFFRVRADRK
jgi:hypothetical protein